MSEENQARILVVDDDAGMRRAVERTLAPPYSLYLAGSPLEALQGMDRASFDVALIDIQLGGDVDGYDLCQQVRGRSPETDVILMTGSASEPDEKLFRSLEEGAFYFLFKPFERRLLRALVDRCLQLQKERTAKERYALELKADLEKARRFQESLVPRHPIRRSGWRVGGRIQPCDELAGDLCQFLVDADENIVVSVSDVVGHGVGAALYAGMLRSTLDAARRKNPEPAALNRELQRGIDFFEAARYATCFYGQLYPDGRLRYFNAGHPPAIWLRQDGEVRLLGATGLVLTASLPDMGRDVREVELSRGDRLLVYTDGVTEAANPRDEELGLSGLREAFEGCRESSPEAALEVILERVRVHRDRRPLNDDLTLLLVERE